MYKDGKAVALTTDHKPNDASERARIEASGHEVAKETVLVNGDVIFCMFSLFQENENFIIELMGQPLLADLSEIRTLKTHFHYLPNSKQSLPFLTYSSTKSRKVITSNTRE
jgi:hypothetical protein